MPNALMLTLQRRNDAPLPAAAGEMAHAAFFTLLSRHHPALATALHEREERKPFTLGLPKEESERPLPGSAALLRLTFLDDSLFPLLAGAALAGGLDGGLRLGAAHFDITGLLATPGSHPDAGNARYANLLCEADAAPRLTLRFLTPTCFRSQGRSVLWPEPRLLWQSWARAWNSNVGEDGPALDEECIVQKAESLIGIERYDLKTRFVPLKNGGVNGFTGTCVFDLRELPEDARRVLTALADFAFYAGTGRKTAMGFGQTRRLKEKS